MVEYATMNFRKTVSSLSEAEDSDTASFSGIITDVTINFPSGANGLVEVFLFLEGTKIFPDSRVGIAFTESIPKFQVMEKVGAGQIIKIKLINHDNSNEHTISVALNLESGTEPVDVYVVGGSLTTNAPAGEYYPGQTTTRANKDMNCCGPYKGR